MVKKGVRIGLQVALYAIVLIGTVGCFGLAAYIYQKGIAMTCRVVLLSMMAVGSVLYAVAYSRAEGAFQYDKEKHLFRFFFLFFLCALTTCLLPLLPYQGWIFPAMAVTLALFSNTVIGIVSISVLLCLVLALTQIPIYVGMLFFVSSMIFILLFSKLDQKFEIGLRTFISMFLYTIVLMICVVFQDKEQLAMEDFMIPVMGLFANFILICAVLRMYSVLVIHKLKDRYEVINDQEYDLMKSYKDEKEVYYHAIHTAYFCEKIARALHMNIDLAKAGGYYHKIVTLEADKSEQSIQEICSIHNFPEELEKLLEEYTDKAKPICMKEATLLLFADTIVSSIIYILQKDKDTEIDYPKIIHAIFKRKEESGILNQSDITLMELHGMEQIFAGEKLYYDFLR